MQNPNLDANSDNLNAADKEIESALRPKLFEQFSGQPQILLKQPNKEVRR